MPSNRRMRGNADSDRLDPPKHEADEVANALAKSVIQGVPFVGPAAAELFGIIVAPTYQRRLAEWMNEVADRIRRLEEQVEGFHVAQLAEDEAFATTVSTAALIAARNHQPGKREALRNAVLNAAIGREPDESVQMVFLQFIDQFTEWHLAVLNFFDDPKAWYTRHGKIAPEIYMGGHDSIFDPAFPQLAGERELKEQVIRDLNDRGLMAATGGMMSANGLWAPRTKPWGKRFLRFVSEP